MLGVQIYITDGMLTKFLSIEEFERLLEIGLAQIQWPASRK